MCGVDFKPLTEMVHVVEQMKKLPLLTERCNYDVKLGLWKK